MTFKIENYEGTADTFNFPNNSVTFDDASQFEYQRTDVPFDNKHIFITKGSLKPKTLTMQGYFTGASKETTWRTLLEHASSPVLKKFYFESDRFYLVLSPQFKKTHSAGRNNFLDYVGSFVTPIPFIFHDTLRYSAVINGYWSINPTIANGGTHTGYIEHITFTLSGSGSAGQFIEFKDAYNGGIYITLPAYTNGDVVDIRLVSMIDSNGFKITEYWYTTINSVQIQRSTPSGKSELGLIMPPHVPINTNISVLTNITIYPQIDFYFRYTYI